MPEWVVQRRPPRSEAFARRRGIFRRRVLTPYRRPWELLRDGVPIGFYETPEAAAAASPEPVRAEA